MKKNRSLMVKMLVFVLLFKMTAVACYAANDPSLIGTWEIYDGSVIFQFDGSNYQVSIGIRDKTKGTYTTNAGILKTTPTHFFGNSSLGLKEKWYSKSELEEDKDFAEYCSKNGIKMTLMIEGIFETEKYTYTFDFNRLILGQDNDIRYLWKKQ